MAQNIQHGMKRPRPWTFTLAVCLGMVAGFMIVAAVSAVVVILA